MLLFICKMGVQWYFHFVVKTADNGVTLLKYSGGGPIHARVPIHAHP